MRYLSFLLLLSLLAVACQQTQPPLPHLGFHDVDAATGDTLYHRIPAFSFIDQDSQRVTNATFANKVYVSDFFFTSCPTICPTVKREMLRILENFRDDDRVLLLSHTIDPKRDSVARLRTYAQGLGVQDADKWHFVTGDRYELYDIAPAYLSVAVENADAPGGFDHSGYIVLVDRDGHVRAYASGVDPEEVDRLLVDIDRLLDEQYSDSAQ